MSSNVVVFKTPETVIEKVEKKLSESRLHCSTDELLLGSRKVKARKMQRNSIRKWEI